MSLIDTILGRPLASNEAAGERMSSATGVPTFGLDALSSAAYGPEAALTVLIPLGAAGLTYIFPITLAIVCLLGIVYFSYRQTIAAYPNGGGSYTVARANLGAKVGLVAAAALMTDYVLNVAVGISAGVGALISAIPKLQPYTLEMCLVILVLLTFVNLRGIGEAGTVFMVPTLVFVFSLGALVVWGTIATIMSGGHPHSTLPPTHLREATRAVGVWLLLRAFASGCTAMTGVEAVSNGVQAFREPVVPAARRTLAIIIVLLMLLLLGIAYLAHAYGVGAIDPGTPQYRSVLSQSARRGSGPRRFLLGEHDLDPAGLVHVRQHFICRFPTPLSRSCRGWLPAAFLYQPRSASRVYRGDSDADSAGRRAPDLF